MGDVQSRALREAADEWTRGGWSDAPRHADRAQDRIAYAQYVGDWLRERADSLAEQPDADADMRAFGASDAACYKWPGDTEKDRACRAAYMEGAADCGGRPDGWRDIADAPRDGTEVIVSNGAWVTAGHWCETITGGAWYGINNDPTDAWGNPLLPTHWLPLPAPPKLGEPGKV